MNRPIPSSLAQAIARFRETQNAKTQSQSVSPTIEETKTVLSTTENSIQKTNSESTSELQITLPNDGSSLSGFDKFGNTITYNSKQKEFIDLASTGSSCILIGAAGTGKTTSQRGAINAMLDAGMLPPMDTDNHKYLIPKSPGIVICAFTRRATNNIRKNLSDDLQANCITIHKLLEYEPVYYEDYNSEGKLVKTMRFEPTRNSSRPISPDIRTIVIEESSMVSVELFQQIREAAPHDPQFIFLGDIQQLPPVFGSAILGYKMLELPTVELTEVYRQALDSPIISLAHRILSGRAIPLNEYQSHNRPGLTLHPWKKKISPESATLTLAKFFIAHLDAGKYNPASDAILIPFNKSCGTDELNNHIANRIAQRESRPVWEIIHGWKRSYYSIGDKCLYDKEDCVVRNIYSNPEYSGVTPREESTSMDYWGNKTYNQSDSNPVSDHDGADEIDILLQNVAASDAESEDRVRAASHVIELEMLDSERTIRIKAAGELNNLSLGYAITVHKSQGSEWEKVYFCLHKSHATMIQRELLYTAVTRAKKELFIICEDDSFTKGILNQRIKGNTLAEKAEYFKGKLERGELQS